MVTKVIFLAVIILALPASAFNNSHNITESTDKKKPPTGFIVKKIQISPVTAKEAEDAFQDALREELPGLSDVTLVDTQPHQLHVQPHGAKDASASAVKVDASPDKDSHVSEFEKEVTDLVLGLSKQGAETGVNMAATPMGGSVQKLQNVIEKEMMPKVKGAHDANQKELNMLAAKLIACGVTQKKVAAKVAIHKTIYEKMGPIHKTCRTTEAALYMENVQAWTELKSLRQIKIALCTAYSQVSKKLGEQNNNKEIVSKSGNENVETYIRRITMTICGKPGGKGVGGNGKGGFLDEFLIAKEKCEVATKNFNVQEAKCKALDKQWRDTRTKCDNIQEQMDKASCKYAVTIKDSCESYSECYKDSRAAYDTAETMVRQEEIDRKAEWRGIMRMKCLITAFADGKVESAEIDKCKAATVNTDYFIIKYPQTPSLRKCEVPTLFPYTPAYIAKEFSKLPAMAKGSQRNQCAGLREISTLPKAGSPQGCKCERVTLNGPYSAQAMVKCESCIATRRASDKNSCPLGTKLFSPQSRGDWETFLKSADPVRAPNWIVDVTRPQNGCGGCTRFPMNHAEKGQESWVTVDHSPWWLRSTPYKEPNGDYHANCYMDLWHNPKDADSVTFNDGSCGYHSKSYYCQAVRLTSKPKPGSPNGCKCSRVAIAAGGTYSQQLLKCENCLKVFKANDKNSCPFGTKIFAPASRADWKAFIASAAPLRAPHWIIDVTRPQNGCGGCTKHAMNSAVAEQATWRTADKAPWWLRSTRYNEPNGDYTANCYLDLWRTPANENSVTWNDGKCNYHSKSYYCQTAQAPKRKVTTAPPPWKAVVSTKPKAGSPPNCTCTRLPLKGQYSAGVLLKCEQCIDVKKKADKDSCPDGTKLWAPATREDWKTFFASNLGPLRAPNWIIDVTRPQNGCGGCTTHAMNSAVSAQSTWKTSDSSPWWLRDRTYNEPNGDYEANCYLDLWQTPKDENSVTWNDKKCTYHSSSYYCQRKNM